MISIGGDICLDTTSGKSWSFMTNVRGDHVLVDPVAHVFFLLKGEWPMGPPTSE